jgi:hypothetical protein
MSQRQGGQAGLSLTDQVDRQKPYRQRQLGALEQRSGDEQGLLRQALHREILRVLTRSTPWAVLP